MLFYKTVCSEQDDLAVNIPRPDLKYLKIWYLMKEQDKEGIYIYLYTCKKLLKASHKYQVIDKLGE